MTATPQNLPRETLRILKPYLALVIGSALLGVVSGLGITTLLATINAAMTGAVAADRHLALKFAGLCTLIVSGSLFSSFTTGYVGQRVLAQLRKDMAARILVAPIDQLERYGSHKLIPVLVRDTGVLGTFVLSVAPLVVAFTVTLGGIIYLSMLSPPMLLITLLAMAIGTAAQWLAFRRGMRGVMAARDAEDDLQKYYEAISDGAKELRIQRARRHRLLNWSIRTAAERICDNNIGSSKFFIAAETFGGILFFIVIGLAIAVQSIWPDADKAALGGFVLVMLYLKGSLAQLTNALPMISSAQVSLRRIIELAEQFSSPEPHLLVSAADNNVPLNVETIELRDVCYTFPGTEEKRPFQLGPVNLSIHRGDIVFIVGENGSGKTTLIKLLLGLYAPHAGEILRDNQPVSAAQRDDYRQLFTTIFSDYYLFDELPCGDNLIDGDGLYANAQKYLKKLDLAHKVTICNGRFSTTALSTGQRKRLALLNAWLENRPVLLFDEWAADQDPSFRRVFYTELLPELKRQGKTIIAISHDDGYFDIADHLVRMESGQVLVESTAAQGVIEFNKRDSIF